MRRTLQPTLLLATVAFTALMLRSAVPRVQNGVWEPRGAMPAARSGAAAAFLADDRMLVIGGMSADGVLASVDAYGEFGAFSPVASMNVARKDHTATVLEDGRVLVSGGTGADGAPLGDAEIYDPDGDSWTLAAGAMIEARSGHVAVRLQDGKVLIVGGAGALGPIDTLEVFEPRTGAFSAIPSRLAAPRTDLAAARLNDGTVLVIGGSDGSGVLSSVDLYNPSTGSVVRTGNLVVPRRGHSATTLTDGRVVVIGGSNGSSDVASAEIYDPVTRTFSYLASGLEAARRDHSAFLLPFNGSVLVVGGSSSGQALSSAELFLPWTGMFQTTGSLADARDGSAGGPLAEPGTLLVAGGRGVDSSELYGFACVVTDTDDYGPGETAFINGRGFQPNEAVTLEVDHVTGAFGDAPGHLPWTVTTDAQGDFTSSWYVDPADSIGMLFKLTAQNAEGLHAETLFKDGPKVGTVTVGPQTPATIRPSVSATYVVTVERGTGPGSFTATLSMTSTLPAGVTASFSPNPVSFTPSQNSRTATLTITTTSATPGGVVPFTVKAATSASDFALGDGSLTVDNTGPDTTIASHPAQPANSASASFTFSGTDDFTSAGSLTFECDLDGGGFSACSSPKSYAGLSNASHTFRVRAKDQAGNLDSSPDSFTWTIDTVAPGAPSTPDLHSASDSGSSTGDNITNVSAATFTGTAEAGSTVKLFSDGVEKGSAVAAGGNYSITTSSLVQGPHAITASATDGAGNTSAGSGSLTVTIDLTPPVIAAHALVSQEAADASGAVVTYVSPTTSDAVDGAGVASCSPASGTVFALGETSVSCQATDAAGNAAVSTSFIVKVKDTTAPVIAAHADIVEEATSAAGAVVSYTVPTISDAVDGAGSASCSPASGSTFALGVTSVSCHATDAAGNAAVSTSFNVKVQDTTAPVIAQSAQAIVIAEATSAAGAAVTFVSPTTTDAVDGAGVAICSPASGSTFALGETSVSCHATDAAGNAAAPKSFIVKVQDTTAPVIAAHAGVVEEATSAAGAVVTYSNPSTSDAVDGAGAAICSPASGGTFALGLTSVSCHATDAAGNVALSTSFTVKVQDTTAPVIAAHADMIEEATSAAGAVVTYSNPSTSDAVDGAGAASCSPASGGTFALGLTSVSCHATDAAGNVALSTSFTVKVQDTTAPVIAAHADLVEEATSAAGAVVTFVSPATTDAVDGAGAANCSPVSGSVFALGETSVSCHATDAAGNVAVSTSFSVRVQDTTAPVIAAHADMIEEANSAAGAIVNFVSPSTSDAVDGAGAASCSPASGSVFALGETSVSCHATDAAGNVALSTSFTVKVQDTTAPVIAAHADMVEEATSAAGAVVTYSDPSTSDAVDGAGAASCSPASGSVFALGMTSVSCHATDAAGNVALSTSFTVKVQDTTAPVIAAHTDVVEEATSAAGAVVTFVSPATTDAVDGAGAANCSPASGSVFALGETSVSCHATDAAGNVALSTSFTVKVQDTTAPVIAAHADMVEEATSAAGAGVSYSNPSTSDAVDGAGAASCSPVSGSVFALGETLVSCHAVDAAGNIALSTSFTVKVQDTTAPVIAAHADMIEEATSAAGAVVSYSSPSTSDVVDGAGSAICSPASGGTFALGMTSVSCHATDVAGNVALSTSFTVKVQDTTPPVAQPETYVIDEDATLNLNPPGILANDADFFALTAVQSSGTSSGALTLVADGSFSYAPAANFNGTDTFSYRAHDSNSNESAVTTVTITVRPVNDAPTFTMGANPSVVEDSGPQSVVWATALSAGPSDEASQALSFVVGNDNTALFAAQPAIASDGTLSVTPAVNANGSATVTVELRDDGGTANGGVDRTAPRTFTITVLASNDAPSFTRGGNQVVLEDAGSQTASLWATGISPGPANESSQSVSFIVTNDNNAMFSVQPAVSSAGTLTYTPAANANGSATVTVRIHDGGGTANGGVDTSAAQTFTISVTGVNDAPSFVKGPGQTVARNAGPQTVAGWAGSISAGPANESGQSVTFVVSNDNNALFSVQPKISPNGTLTFTPAPTSIGPASATVSVQLRDDGGTANGGVETSAIQTFTIYATYAFTGFFEPVDNLPTVNRVNSGSAVPLKFSLAGNQGLDIFAAGYPASVKVNCDTGSAVDDIETTETAGSSSLTYDSGAGQYKYVWKTERSWTNTCRQLLVRFKDGTADKVAVFKFK